MIQKVKVYIEHLDAADEYEVRIHDAETDKIIWEATGYENEEAASNAASEEMYQRWQTS